MINTLLEIMYIICGIILIVCGVYALFDKENSKKLGTACFWIIFGFIFMAGPYINPVIVGVLLLIMGILTATKNVKLGSLKNSDDKYREAQEEKIGNKIFIPALSIGVVAFSIAQFTKLGGLIGLGIGALVSLLLTMLVTKENIKNIPYDSSRMLQQMGPSVILPQLLGALGALFAKAGVGEVVAGIMGGIIPDGSKIFGVIGYCVAMAVFTMIMGNAFAAFAVITAGIGVPFVINIGGNPAIVGALGLTAGYCGTLLTPMAANFNIVPASILEMENKNGIILSQAPIAIALLIIHIILMYLLAF
ncbi:MULTISPECIES: DUF979 domain-containing protein [Fusobacterium]|uniref:DUF979 domain-containing protein n=1 Tax=Fusobacterium TaxID=848 RepID=UPI000481D872|nr:MULTISPECIES: DUF979 domain-containing protein [Fusobacterium]MCI6152410.1 DUF979 domain-containing protein [Fusobacterium perfoetens]MDY3237009.1 DUF979 domain-containing protein [Fusobacterium perfoetens]NME35007.1 DUF979 domain-containing protein [Fusobacterium sp. FSA-380-WT-3A]